MSFKSNLFSIKQITRSLHVMLYLVLAPSCIVTMTCYGWTLYSVVTGTAGYWGNAHRFASVDKEIYMAFCLLVTCWAFIILVLPPVYMKKQLWNRLGCIYILFGIMVTAIFLWQWLVSEAKG